MRRLANPKMILVAVLVVLGCAVAGSLVLPTAESAPACGTVQVAGGDWLNGQGVDVRSNGQYQTKGTSCANGDKPLWNLSANPPMFGYGWQCVELVNRLYASKGWYTQGLWIGPEHNHGAKGLYPIAASGKYDGLTAHENGRGYIPVPGDMIVHGNGSFGHVAVVDRIEGNVLHAVEQNSSVTGRATYGFDPKTGAVSRGNATITGYVHAEKNQFSATPAPSSSGEAPSPSPSGISYVLSDDPNLGVAIRPCSRQPNHEEPACGPIGRLPDRTQVIMRCWTDHKLGTVERPRGTERWFYVNVVGTQLDGQSGFIFASLVKDQIRTPECTDAIYEQYANPKYVPPPSLVFKVIGFCTTAGGTLTAESANFTPGADYGVSATYPNGQPYTKLKTIGVAKPDGSVVWTWPCQGDPPGRYTTSLVDYGTGRSTGDVAFTVNPAPVSSPPPPQPPVPPQQSSPAPAPPPPAERVITVHNVVTNGATQMREDDPAYLSTITRNYCRRDGCMLSGTEVGTGARLTATCQTRGARTTNGEDGRAGDDGNPGLYESTLWYGIRWGDGRTGFISETWIQGGDRGGLGLPGC